MADLVKNLLGAEKKLGELIGLMEHTTGQIEVLKKLCVSVVKSQKKCLGEVGKCPHCIAVRCLDTIANSRWSNT